MKVTSPNNEPLPIYSKLTPAQIERLDYLSEEAAEIIKAVCKIKRHGFKATDHVADPPKPYDNRAELITEIKDVLGAVSRLIYAGDLPVDTMAFPPQRFNNAYMHHQDDIPEGESGRPADGFGVGVTC